ncbi:MAG: hypothetical protein FWE87_01040 [Coriobacteriia bacterium]|nr:hypothetical protein [Coriobacteriia bacterium]
MIDRLACNLGRNDEAPNIELAQFLAEHEDTEGIAEIVEGFKGADAKVASDSIKVLYEIGKRAPQLIAPYTDDFITGLRSRNNRLIWGSMAALAGTTPYAAQLVHDDLPLLIRTYEQGSVITVDNSISVFAHLAAADEGYAEELVPLLLKHLKECKPKSVAQHAERASVCFDKTNAPAFIEVLERRLPHLSSPAQARVNKLLRSLHALAY